MSLGAIRKETGRATYDEILRLRLRLDHVENYRNSLPQALAATGTDDGPVGGFTTVSADGRYLKLAADNDPLTGSLECIDVTLNSGDLSVAAGKVTISNTARGLNVNTTTTDSSVNINVNGDPATLLSPDDATNAAGNLFMWFESDQLTTFSDGADLPAWYNMGLGATSNLEQGSAAKRPHFRSHASYLTPLGKPGVVSDTAIDQHFTKVSGGNDFVFGNGANFGVVLVYRTDDSASSNNILCLGNSSTSSKQSFRPVGNTSLGNSYVYTPTDNLVTVGNSAGFSGGTWHCALFWYDSSDNSSRVWIDGTEVSSGATTALNITIDMVMRDINLGGQEGVNLGTGLAAIVGFGYGGSGAAPDLTEMQQVHDFIADEYMGSAYQINGTTAAGDILTLQNGGTTKSVFDLEGKLHIGGTDPQAELDVEGSIEVSVDAAITGQITGGSLSITGLSTLSGVSAGAASADSLSVTGLSTLSSTEIGGTTFSGTWQHAAFVNASSGPSLHMTGPGPNFTWIEDNHTTQSDWRVRLNSGQIEWRDNVGISGINTVLTLEPGAPTDCWTFRDTGDIRIDTDNAGLELGEGQDATIQYDGTDLVVNPQAVGSGSLKVSAGHVLITGPGYVQMSEMSTPATPASGTTRIFLNSATGELSVVKSSGSVVSLEGSGTATGSSGNTMTGGWVVDLPLSSPATEDDEFEDASLAGKWTETDTSANFVFTETAYGLWVDPSGGANANLGFLHQAKPSGSTTYTVMAKISIVDNEIHSDTSYMEAGVGVFEDVATNPTTDGVGFVSLRFDRNSAPDRLYVIGQHWQDYDTYTANLGSSVNSTAGNQMDPSIPLTLYLRLRKSGTTYGMDFSSNGFDWAKIYEGTITEVGSNDSRVGLVFRANGTPDTRALVHWFRVVDGTADFFQQPPGRRHVFFAP